MISHLSSCCSTHLDALPPASPKQQGPKSVHPACTGTSHGATGGHGVLCWRGRQLDTTWRTSLLGFQWWNHIPLPNNKSLRYMARISIRDKFAKAMLEIMTLAPRLMSGNSYRWLFPHQASSTGSSLKPKKCHWKGIFYLQFMAIDVDRWFSEADLAFSTKLQPSSQPNKSKDHSDVYHLPPCTKDQCVNWQLSSGQHTTSFWSLVHVHIHRYIW